MSKMGVVGNHLLILGFLGLNICKGGKIMVRGIYGGVFLANGVANGNTRLANGKCRLQRTPKNSTSRLSFASPLFAKLCNAIRKQKRGARYLWCGFWVVLQIANGKWAILRIIFGFLRDFRREGD
jgi:hypothetical protein